MDDVRRIVISGVPPYDGEYALEDRAFSTREWSWIKRISGYMPLTLAEGEEGGDPSVIVAIAVIAMHRAGRIDRDQALKAAEALEDAPFDGAAISVIIPAGSEEPDAPLGSTSEPAPSSPSRPLENPPSSGDASKTATAPLGKTRVSTGTSGSDMSPGSGLERLAI